MNVHRNLQATLTSLAQKSPVVTLTAPCQAGTTTLCGMASADKPYVYAGAQRQQRAAATVLPWADVAGHDWVGPQGGRPMASSPPGTAGRPTRPLRVPADAFRSGEVGCADLSPAVRRVRVSPNDGDGRTDTDGAAPRNP